MKITDVTTHVLGTPWRDLTFVQVHTDEGLTGVGETRMLGHTQALLGYLAEAARNHVLGSDPFEIESLVQRMKYGDYGRAGEIVMSGIACVEMACWDIMGKALGQPVYRLLGGAVNERVKAYANGWYTVERSPEEFHAAATRVVERGYRALKFDPFGEGRFELSHEERMRSVALVEAVRDAVGPEVELLVEMHGRFAPHEAIRVAGLLEEFQPAWLEEPVPPENLKALAKVAAHTPLPIATGERIHDRMEFRELFESQAAGIIQPDVGHIGGILEARKLAATAETHYVLVAPHNVGGPVLTAASLHLAACTPNFKIQEHFNDFADHEVLQAAPGLPPVVDGYFALPQGPGLGVTLDVDFVAERPSSGAHFDLFAHDWQFRGDEVTAVRIETPGSIGLVDAPAGAPEVGEALVKIAYAGICGSDRELLEGSRPAEFVRYPVVPGHEWSGVVEAVGAGADPRLIGRKVVGEGFRNCQACDACRTGQTTLCEAPYEETGFTQPGAWNEFLRLPARLLHVLPDDADLRSAALLEPAACVAEACLLAGLVPGERAAVVGGGTLGLLSAQLLRASSPRELVVVARRTSRAALARRMGADHLVAPDDVEPGFDVVIEAAGTPGSAQLAVDIARRGGRVVLTGIPGDVSDAVSAQRLVTQAVTVFNVFGAPSRAWVHTVRAFAAGLLAPAPLITHELPLSEIQEAFRVMAEEPAAGKILLRP